MRITEFLYSRIYRHYFGQYARWLARRHKRNCFFFRCAAAAAYCFFPKKFTAYLAKTPLKKQNNRLREHTPKIIASLTTFPARIEKVWISVATILMQSMPPDAVELWLAEEQFPNGLDGLPDSLLRLREYGLEINFCEDLRSHKKYYGSMQKHPEDIVVIFDDDFFYPPDAVEKVWNLHTRAPRDVVGTSSTKFSKEDLMNPLDWQMQNGEALHQISFGICGGSCTLFPPRALHPYAFDKEAIRKLSPLADDQWLTAMTYMNGRKISSVGRLPFPVSVQGTQSEALTNTNNFSQSTINNNTQWKAILDYYQEELRDWIKRVEADGE